MNEAAPWPLLLQQEHNDISPLTATTTGAIHTAIRYKLFSALTAYEPNLPSSGQEVGPKSAHRIQVQTV